MRPTFFEITTAGRVPSLRRCRGRRGGDRGRPARPVGRHQRGPAGRWPWSPTSGSTTPTSPGRPCSTSPARRPASSKPGAVLVLGETDPELAEIFRGRRARPPPSSAASTSTASATSWRSAGGCSTCAPRPRCTPRCSCRCTDATRATTRPSRCAQPRRSSVPRSPRTWSRRRSPRCGGPAGSRCSATSRSSSSTAPTTRPAPISCAEVFFDDFDPVGRRILVVGCLREKDPDEMLERAAGRRVRPRLLHHRADAAGSAGRRRGRGGPGDRLRRRARSRRPGAGVSARRSAKARPRTPCSSPARSTWSARPVPRSASSVPSNARSPRPRR